MEVESPARSRVDSILKHQLGQLEICSIFNGLQAVPGNRPPIM